MPLRDKKSPIVGIAKEHSIAYGCARAFRDAGVELAITYHDAKVEPYVPSPGGTAGKPRSSLPATRATRAAVAC